MKFIIRLIALFTIIPLVELVILLKFAQMTSVGMTLVVVIVTGVIGGVMAKSEGLAVWRRFLHNMQHGIMPADEMVEGILILLAGALLITPGLLTDITGFILLAPPARKVLREKIKDKIQKAIQRGAVHISFHNY